MISVFMSKISGIVKENRFIAFKIFVFSIYKQFMSCIEFVLRLFDF